MLGQSFSYPLLVEGYDHIYAGNWRHSYRISRGYPIYDIPYVHKLFPGGKPFTLLLVIPLNVNAVLEGLVIKITAKYRAGHVVAPNDCNGMDPDPRLMHIGMIVGSFVPVPLLGGKGKGKGDMENSGNGSTGSGKGSGRTLRSVAKPFLT